MTLETGGEREGLTFSIYYLVYLAFTDKSEGLVSHEDEDESLLLAARTEEEITSNFSIFEDLTFTNLEQ